MKLIFTDIDGVLNHSSYNPITGGNISPVEEKCVNNLKKIVDATGASVVVVSRANAFMGKMFEEERLNDIRKYGVNPIDSISNRFYVDTIESKAYPIKRWLNKNGYNDVNYVVIDDCPSNLKQEFGNKFIHIKGKAGLTSKTVESVIEILNNG